jgi:plastocyanin
MKKTILVIVILAVGTGGYFLLRGGYKNLSFSETPSPDNLNSSLPSSQSGQQEAAVKTVSINNFAFNPDVLHIAVGATVRWINEDSFLHQIASNPHPVHTDLPGLDSGNLSAGRSYDFTFTEAGTFGYHCHLHPFMEGKIIVE